MSTAEGIVRDADSPLEEPLTYWERVARTRWGRYTTHVVDRAVRESTLLAGSPTVAIEIGCDGGRWSALLARAGWSMVCTDIDLSTLSICKRRLPDALTILVRDTMSGIPCRSQSVGMAVCLEVGPVVQSSWFLPEVSRILVKGGLLVGVFYNRCSLRGLFVHAQDLRRGSFDYYRLAYVPWRTKLRQHGFSLVHEEGCCWFPFSRTSDSRLVPAFTGLERFLGLRRLAALSPWVVFVARKNETI